VYGNPLNETVIFNDHKMDQWDDTNSSNQWWKLVNLGGGYFSLVNDRNGLYLDVSGRSTAGGSGGQKQRGCDNGERTQYQRYARDS
jgi:mannan endo-1,4-beta-mannosidase